MRHKDELAAKVAAVNLAHKAANELHPVLAEYFRPLVGQTITKKDGTLLERIKKLLPKFNISPNISVFGSGSRYSLSFTIKTVMNYGTHFCTYYEVNLFIGNMRNGVLTDMEAVIERPTNYTVEDVLEKRAAAKRALTAYHEARSDCDVFGE